MLCDMLQLTCCIAAMQNGLRYLDFSNMQLSGSIPDCLFAAPSTLSQVGFAHNNLTGTIPDVIPTNSPLYGVVLASNNLTGTIPGTLRNAGMLSNLELNDNQLQGSMPEDFAAGMSMLDSVQLSSNALTGQCTDYRADTCCSSSLDFSALHCTSCICTPSTSLHCTPCIYTAYMACACFEPTLRDLC